MNRLVSSLLFRTLFRPAFQGAFRPALRLAPAVPAAPAVSGQLPARGPAWRRHCHPTGLLHSAGLLCLVAAGALSPARAEAQVSRCVDRQGNSVFTDRPCEAVDSASRVPQAARGSARGSAYRGACARSLPMLIRDLSSAIQSGDANRLGMLYLWAGVSDADALRTLNRLQSIAERPLVDIVTLRREVTVAIPPPAAPGETTTAAAAPPPPAAAPAQAMHWEGDGARGAATARSQATPRPGSAPGSGTSAGPAPGPAEAAAPQTRTRSVVTGLRLQQTAGKRATPVAVMLGLRRAYDCWWINLPAG